jgi:cytidylate kinase
MKHAATFEKCKSYLDCQLQPAGGRAPLVSGWQRGPAVTISRQTGSGAHAVAAKLAEYLQKHDVKSPLHWTVFDKNLVEKVLEEHKLPRRLAQYMPEKRLSYVQDTMEELLSLRPSSWTLIHKTMETILHLAEMGRAIVVGRGANVITGKMPNVFHVRLVGSLPKRLAHVREYYGVGQKEAQELITREDRGRAQYLREHFHCDITDPLQYHLVINTDRISYEEAARLIGDAALNLFRACTPSSD